ncbi:MAG: glycoside hydrolase superfamily [Benjaminiella poitrasii]|nr:MAG: glycoside hydrolase superfamily [Benjaminiella poitrasii]
MMQLLAFIIILSFSWISVRAENRFYGLNYGINPTNCPTLESILTDFTSIKQYTDRVRIFSLSVCNQGELALQAANQLDMNIYLGMWIDRPETFDAEMYALQTLLGQNHSFEKVDAIIVGSEVLYRNDTDANSLANYIGLVHDLASPKGIAVTTADVYYKFPPVIVNKIDFLMINAFPYWEGVVAQEGAVTLLSHYQSVVDKANGKLVRISETGWPTAGGNFSVSVASPADQRIYASDILCLTRKNNIDMLWFSAFDEPYRNGVEAYWGIMHANHTLKNDMSTVLFTNLTC